MLATLTLVLDTNLNYRQSSLLHGLLMEYVDPAYGDYLHMQNLHPYSQYITARGDQSVWVINTLNQDAFENIIARLPSGNFSFSLRHVEGSKICVLDRQMRTLSYSQLLEDFYGCPAGHRFSLEFLTPTAFKQKKRYVILPDMRLVVQSLMMKYSAVSASGEMMDEDALLQIVEDTFLTRHGLHSAKFPVEGQNIPGFVGYIDISSRGTETMARYLRLLFSFGEFSGVGLKSSMGMGALKFKERMKADAGN